MICKICGNNMEDTDLFCMSCGASADGAGGAKKTCPFCGNQEPESSFSCSSCGYSFSDSPERNVRNNNQSETAIQQKNKPIFLIAVIVVLLAMLAFVGVAYINSLKEKAKESELIEERIREQVEKQVEERVEEEVKVKVSEQVEKQVAEQAEKNVEEAEIQPQATEDTKVEEKIIVITPQEQKYNYDDFIFPSDRRYITLSDLLGRTREEIALMRNEIFARHGYIFSTEKYRRYFMSKDWYRPNPHFDESMLSEIESANKSFIVEYEKSMGWR